MKHYSGGRKEMVSLVCKGKLGLATNPQLNGQDPREVAKYVIGKFAGSGRKVSVAFADLAPTREVASLVEELERQGCRLVRYVDHHYRAEFDRPLERIRKCVGEMVRVATREDQLSCCGMVGTREWVRRGADVIIFDDDPDGFWSYLKGCGLAYTKMSYDADKVDGRLSNKAGGLSPNGVFLVNVFQLQGSLTEGAFEEMLQTYVWWLEEGYQAPPDSAWAAEKIQTSVQTATKRAKRLLAKTQVDMYDLALCVWPPEWENDTLTYSLWRRYVYEEQSMPLAFCRIIGSRMVVDLTLRARNFGYRLSDFLNPEHGRVHMQAALTGAEWKQFRARWEERRLSERQVTRPRWASAAAD